jgi:SAM-dependent methyltransferase
MGADFTHDGRPLCPVCKTACDSPPMSRYTAQQAANHFCPPTRDADRNARFYKCIVRLWGGERGEVYRCSNCEFGFAWPHVGGDEEFYSIMHEMAGYPARRWDYEIATEQALNNLQGGRVLDIGTGDGAFLKGLDQRWETFAIEGSETMRQYLREHGIRCFDSLTEALREAGTFTAVTMFQVLEHIAEFDEFLAGCYKLLKPGGLIVIGVPFSEATFFQERFSGFADMTPNHPNKWSPRALEIALRRNGFEPNGTFYEPASMKLAVYRAFLRVKARAQHPRSVPATVYRIQKRALRIPLLAALAGASMLRCLPQLGEMRRGHSFAMIGLKPQSTNGRVIDP